MRPYSTAENFKLYCSDAAAGLAELPAASAQTCITSPPYFGLRNYGVAGQLGQESLPSEYVRNLVSVFRAVRRVLRDDGTLWLNLGDSYCRNPAKGQHKPGDPGKQNYVYTNGGGHASAVFDLRRSGLKEKDLIGIPWRVALALQKPWLRCLSCGTESHSGEWGELQDEWRICPSCVTFAEWDVSEPGWYLRSDVIWHKPNAMPNSVKDRPVTDHEYVFLFSKNPRYYFDYHAIKEPAASGKLRSKRTVWSVNTAAYRDAHFAVFPATLVEPMILASSHTSSTVVDPFFGAGTTGLAALAHGRFAVGIELNPDFCALASRRLGAVPGSRKA